MSEEVNTANWPDPNRPGVPMFPERTLRHALKKKDSGEIIIRNWKSDGQHWDMIGYSAQWCSETYFYEGACLTPAQIAEMLGAERKRAAKAATEVSDTYYDRREEAESDDERVYADERMCAASECSQAIRNLGAEA